MKKLLTFAFVIICLFCQGVVFAEPQQTINNEQSYAVINLQKAPASENKQQIKNTKSWFCVNIIINGKVKTDSPANTDR